MKSQLRVCSLICFVVAIPSLVIVDWYVHGYGLLSMFVSACIGLVFDQIIRINYPTVSIIDTSLYKKNKILKLLSLILFVMSPMILIYGNRFQHNFGTLMFLVFVGVGIAVDILARVFFPLSNQRKM